MRSSPYGEVGIEDRKSLPLSAARLGRGSFVGARTTSRRSGCLGCRPRSRGTHGLATVSRAGASPAATSVGRQLNGNLSTDDELAWKVLGSSHLLEKRPVEQRSNAGESWTWLVASRTFSSVS